MPAPNFEEKLKCPGPSKGVTARGPIGSLGANDVVKELYVWIAQLQPDGTCAISTGELEDDLPGSATGNLTWEVKTKLQPDGRKDPKKARREFEEGPAIAFAIAIFHLDTGAGTEQKVFWWGQNVSLA